MAWKATLFGEGTTLHGVSAVLVGSVQHYWGGSCFAGVGAALLRMDRALLRVDAARLIWSTTQLCAPAAEPPTGASMQYSCSPGCFSNMSPIHCNPCTAAGHHTFPTYPLQREMEVAFVWQGSDRAGLFDKALTLSEHAEKLNPGAL